MRLLSFAYEMHEMCNCIMIIVIHSVYEISHIHVPSLNMTNVNMSWIFMNMNFYVFMFLSWWGHIEEHGLDGKSNGRESDEEIWDKS